MLLQNKPEGVGCELIFKMHSFRYLFHSCTVSFTVFPLTLSALHKMDRVRMKMVEVIFITETGTRGQTS